MLLQSGLTYFNADTVYGPTINDLWGGGKILNEFMTILADTHPPPPKPQVYHLPLIHHVVHLVR